MCSPWVSPFLPILPSPVSPRRAVALSWQSVPRSLFLPDPYCSPEKSVEPNTRKWSLREGETWVGPHSLGGARPWPVLRSPARSGCCVGPGVGLEIRQLYFSFSSLLNPDGKRVNLGLSRKFLGPVPACWAQVPQGWGLQSTCATGRTPAALSVACWTWPKDYHRGFMGSGPVGSERRRVLRDPLTGYDAREAHPGDRLKTVLCSPSAFSAITKACHGRREASYGGRHPLLLSLLCSSGLWLREGRSLPQVTQHVCGRTKIQTQVHG